MSYLIMSLNSYLISVFVQVYEAVVLALEKMDERSLNLVCKLLAALHLSVVVTPDQMREGFLRVTNLYYIKNLFILFIKIIYIKKLILY